MLLIFLEQKDIKALNYLRLNQVGQHAGINHQPGWVSMQEYRLHKTAHRQNSMGQHAGMMGHHKTGMVGQHDRNLQMSLSLFRIMQEAITNIIKHAHAKHAHIRLTASQNAVDLEIQDDGNGFDRNKKALGLGLKTIYTRAEAAGGKAHIASSPGEGTSLSVHIPIMECKK